MQCCSNKKPKITLKLAYWTVLDRQTDRQTQTHTDPCIELRNQKNQPKLWYVSNFKPFQNQPDLCLKSVTGLFQAEHHNKPCIAEFSKNMFCVLQWLTAFINNRRVLTIKPRYLHQLHCWDAQRCCCLF